MVVLTAVWYSNLSLDWIWAMMLDFRIMMLDLLWLMLDLLCLNCGDVHGIHKLKTLTENMVLLAQRAALNLNFNSSV
jgi:hypothetical protein